MIRRFLLGLRSVLLVYVPLAAAGTPVDQDYFAARDSAELARLLQVVDAKHTNWVPTSI